MIIAEMLTINEKHAKDDDKYRVIATIIIKIKVVFWNDVIL